MASDATVGDLSLGDRPGGDEGSRPEPGCPFSPVGGATADGRPKPKRGYFIPGIIALVVCATIAVVIDLAGIQSHPPTTLTGHQVEAFVSQSLQATHPQRDPPQVRCPATEPLRSGITFDCSVIRAGRPSSTIRVSETSRQGNLHFSSPSG
jgi:hypothetical protein